MKKHGDYTHPDAGVSCLLCQEELEEKVRQLELQIGEASKAARENFDAWKESNRLNGLLKDALIEIGVARAAWIHHCHAPEILKALWKVMNGDRPCTHKASEYGPGVAGPGETWTAPGVGAAGYSYCTCCGARNPSDSILDRPLKRIEPSPTFTSQCKCDKSFVRNGVCTRCGFPV